MGTGTLVSQRTCLLGLLLQDAFFQQMFLVCLRDVRIYFRSWDTAVIRSDRSPHEAKVECGEIITNQLCRVLKSEKCYGEKVGKNNECHSVVGSNRHRS